ncbi:hypothetical protein P3S68_020213 [Capsicum galapagoense]
MSASELIMLSDGAHLTDATRYRQVVGRLQYLSFTRPEIAYVVNKLSQFMQTPSDLHWKVVKRVLHYLRGTIQLGLRVTPIEDFNLHVYSDADWGGDIADRVSTSGADAKEEDVELQLWIKQVQDLAHDAQDILEKHVFTCSNFQEKGSWSWRKQHHSSMAEKILKAQSESLSMLLEGIKTRISVISEGHKSFLQKYGVATSAESSNATWCSNHEEVPLDNDIDLVGIEYHKSVFLDWLLSDDPRWKFLCVAGTRGTLVKKVYNDASVKKHFDSLLWIDVSRFSNVKELLTSMITPDNNQTR